MRSTGALLALLALGVLVFFVLWRPATTDVTPIRSVPAASRVSTATPTGQPTARAVTLTLSEQDLTNAAASYMPLTVAGIAVSDPTIRLTPGRLTLTATGRAFFVSGPIVVVATPAVSNGHAEARVESATLAGIGLPDSAKQDISNTFTEALSRSIPANLRVTSVVVGSGTLTVQAVPV